jgi:hypothetical protein
MKEKYIKLLKEIKRLYNLIYNYDYDADNEFIAYGSNK